MYARPKTSSTVKDYIYGAFTDKQLTSIQSIGFHIAMIKCGNCTKRLLIGLKHI